MLSKRVRLASRDREESLFLLTLKHKKMKRKYLMLILMILGVMLAKSQNQITTLAAQDARLLLTGSETYDSGTFNMIYRLQAEAKQDKYGYASIFAEYEIGDLSPNYKRYSLNASYTFNQLFVKNFEVSTYLGYGIIDRGFSKNSLGFGGSINYKLNEKLKLNAIMQVVDRTDLGVLYDDRKYKTSFFVGVSYRIFDNKVQKTTSNN